MTVRFAFHWKMCSYIEFRKKNCCQGTCFCDLGVPLIRVSVAGVIAIISQGYLPLGLVGRKCRGPSYYYS